MDYNYIVQERGSWISIDYNLKLQKYHDYFTSGFMSWIIGDFIEHSSPNNNISSLSFKPKKEWNSYERRTTL